MTWNITALKYQSIICQLFSAYFCSFFWQAATRDNQQALSWDAVKEVLLVWLSQTLHFGPDSNLPPTHGSSGHQDRQHNQELQLAALTKASMSHKYKQVRSAAGCLMGLHFSFTARNLTSALQHPDSSMLQREQSRPDTVSQSPWTSGAGGDLP